MEQDDEERKNICAADFEEKHGLLGSGSSCQSKDREGWSHCCAHAFDVIGTRWRLEHSDVVQRKSSSATGDVPHVSASRIGEVRKESWSSEGNTGRREAKVFRAHAPPHGVCDNLVNALELFANQQTGCNSPVDMLVDCVRERRRLKMEELRRFITEVNHETGKIGDWEKTLESIPVVKSKFSEDVPEAVVREGADELMLRREEEGVLRTLIDTTNVGDIGRKPPLVDETGVQFVRAFTKASRERNGRTCTASTWCLPLWS